MNTAMIVLLACLAIVGVAGVAEAHVTYYNPVTEDCAELEVPAHAHLGAIEGHPECDGG